MLLLTSAIAGVFLWQKRRGKSYSPFLWWLCITLLRPKATTYVLLLPSIVFCEPVTLFWRPSCLPTTRSPSSFQMALMVHFEVDLLKGLLNFPTAYKWGRHATCLLFPFSLAFQISEWNRKINLRRFRISTQPWPGEVFLPFSILL